MEIHEQKLMYEGGEYCLRHVHHKNWNLRLSCGVIIPAFVQFSSHCYTDEVPPERREHLQVVDYYGNNRFFCPTRYNLSLSLESWITGWEGEICYSSKDAKRGSENWIVVERDNDVSVKVAFSVQPNKKKSRGVLLRIKSIHAYEWSKPPGRPHPHLPYNVLLKGVGLGRETPELREKRRRR